MTNQEPLTPRERLMAYARRTIEENRGWEGELISGGEVQLRLGLAPDALTAMRSANSIIAFRRGDGDFSYPSEQLDGRHVVPAVAELIDIIGSIGETWNWLTQSCLDFDDARPIDMLKSRQIAAVIAAARRQYDQL
jgi:hypothetical protein